MDLEEVKPLILKQQKTTDISFDRTSRSFLTPRGTAEKAERDLFDPTKDPPSDRALLSIFSKITIPAVLTNLLFYATIISDNVFAGHMEDPKNLAVVGLTNTSSQVMVHLLLLGLNAAQETLTSQAYGSDNLLLTGIYLNRGRAIVTVFYVLFAMWPLAFGEEIFLFLGMDAEVSKMTQR